jgi:molybdenum-dependent DNA-binding transcriptional regulator ModE
MCTGHELIWQFRLTVRINLTEECQMNTQQKAIKSKVGLLKLAETLGSVSQACKVMDWERQHLRAAGRSRRSSSQTTPSVMPLCPAEDSLATRD